MIRLIKADAVTIMDRGDPKLGTEDLAGKDNKRPVALPPEVAWEAHKEALEAAAKAKEAEETIEAVKSAEEEKKAAKPTPQKIPKKTAKKTAKKDTKKSTKKDTKEKKIPTFK